MKKILVLSDSHGEVYKMQKAVRAENPDMIVHLGDCTRDADTLNKAYPSIPMVSVPGNCDFSHEEPTHFFTYEGFKVLCCHGHTYHVKGSLLRLHFAAKEKQARIALFGHTHRAYSEDEDGVLLLNPGSIGAPIGDANPSYGVIELDRASGELHYELKYLFDEDV